MNPRVVMDSMAESALDRHIKVANHEGQVRISCPVCIGLVTNGVLIRGNDNIYRSIDQEKRQRMSDGRRPGDLV